VIASLFANGTSLWPRPAAAYDGKLIELLGPKRARNAGWFTDVEEYWAR
jgi:hypothetical protein